MKSSMRCEFFFALVLACWIPATVHAADGGLCLTGRALVAVPRADYGVFLTWRYLEQDGAGTGFSVYRVAAGSETFAKIGEAIETSTYLDTPGAGEFSYYVVPDAGALRGERSNVCRVATQSKGRGWVEILPAARGKRIQFSDRHFADTDGDGELEFVTYYPQVPSYRGGVASESYKLEVFELLEDRPPRWTYDTGMGTQSDPAEGDKRTDWDYEWTFKPVAWDIDGDGRAEIVTLAKNGDTGGKYAYVALKDLGDRCTVIATLKSPVPVAPRPNDNNARHFPFFADLGGKDYSLLVQGGTYRYWEMWAYDYNGSGFDLRWYVKSTEPGFAGNRSCSHTVLVADIDGDGLDEINNGATMLDQDGSVLWSANACFGDDMHVDGQVIDDIDPSNPGLEAMMHAEWGNVYALFDARSGRLLWKKKAPGNHLQLNVAADFADHEGLEIVGTYGGHRPRGGFACTCDGADLAYPFPSDEFPINGDRIWAMDWDGAGGGQVCLNFTRIFGRGAKLLYEVDLSDAPHGDVIPWNEHKLNHLWFNVDIIGDHREEIPIQMGDAAGRGGPCAYLQRVQFLPQPGGRGRCRLLGAKTVLHVHGAQFDQFASMQGATGRWFHSLRVTVG